MSESDNSRPIKSIEHIRKIASIMDIDYDVKTNEFTQFSNDRFLLQELLMHYQQALDKIAELEKENQALGEIIHCEFCTDNHHPVCPKFIPYLKEHR